MIAAVDIARALAVPGFMHRDELQWLAERASVAATVIEAGCWQGRSTRALADHCPGTVYAVDPWAGPYLCEDGSRHPIRTEVYEQFAEHLADHIARGRVVPIRKAFSDSRADLVGRCPNRADLVFIDGDHRFATVAADIDTAIALVRPGGIIAGHDYGHRDWPGVKRAVDAWFGASIERCRSIWWTTI